MLALLDRDMGNIVQSLGALVAKDLPPADKLRIHIGAVIDTYHAFPYLNRLLMRMVRDSALPRPRALPNYISGRYPRPMKCLLPRA